MSGREPGPARSLGKEQGIVELTFPSASEYLTVLRAAIRSICEKVGFDDDTCGRVILAVVEAFTNIIRHAYSGDTNQRVIVRCREITNGIEIELIDHGQPINSEAVPPPHPADDPKPGGLGVHIMKTCMDQVLYQRMPEGGNRVLLRKCRSAIAPAGATGERARKGGDAWRK